METKMKVIGVISSAREDSNSAAMVRSALHGAASWGLKTEEIYLPSCDLKSCTGCLTCLTAGKCRQSDGFNELRNRLYQADGIIWGSPTYAGAPNAIMKNFIDRLGMYEMSTSSLGGKYMAGISSASAAGAANKVARALSGFGVGGTFQRSYRVGALGAGFRGGRQAQKDVKLLAKAEKLGIKLARAIKDQKSYAFQGLWRRMINSWMMKPVFGKYIRDNKDGATKALYENLHKRGLIN